MATGPTSNGQALQSCPLVPLSAYNWSGKATSSSLYCSRLALNYAIYYLIIATHVSVYWLMGVLSYKVVARFTRWKSAYFWSLQWTVWSVILHCIAQDLHLFSPSNDSRAHHVHLVLMTASQPGTTSSFPLILWSRLHLVCHNRKLLRGFLAAIIITGLPVSICKIVGYMFVSTKDENIKLGRQLLSVGSYLMPTILALELLIMITYIRKLYEFAQPQSWKAAATWKLLWPLLAAMGFTLIFFAACLTTVLAGFPTAHDIVSVAWALQAWTEYGVLIHITKFSTRVHRGVNQNEPVVIAYDDVRPNPSCERSSGSEGKEGRGFVIC